MNRNASAFAGLREHLSLSFDDFIRTSSDPRHRPGVERLWRACDGQRRPVPQELRGAVLRRLRAVLHATPSWPTATARTTARRRSLSRGELVLPAVPLRRPAARPDQLRPAADRAGRRRNEVLGFIAGGLEDFSASRSVARARGWGIAGARRPQPGDLRLVGRARQLHHLAGLRRRRRWRRRLPAAGGPAPTGACTWSARACCGSTRSTGPRSCCRRASRCRPRSSCTTT